MRRRDFIKGIAGSTIAWPLAAAAQQREQKRRVVVLMGGLTQGEADGQAEVVAFEEGLKEIGWKLGGNIELDYRWPGAELAQVSVVANEIIAMRPDLVVSRSTPATAIMLNRGLPIVFVLVADPISSGFVQNWGHPGGSVTGFSVFETSVGGKWLGLLKEAAPTVSRVSLLFNPETAPFADGYLHSAQAAAPTLGATVIPAPCGSIADIEGAFAARAREDAGGIIIINDTFLVERRHLITEFATRYRLPTIYAVQIYVPSRGLISYAATIQISFGAPHHMSIASCVVRGLATCRFRNRPNSRCRSISRLHEQSVSTCRSRSLLVPTR